MTENTNGHSNGEHSADDFLPPHQASLPEVARLVHERVQSFLDQEPETEQIRHAQEQTRISLGVIKEAFKRYE
jgi:hypothetical protein